MAVKLIVKKTEPNGAVSVSEVVIDEALATIGSLETSTLFLDDSQILEEQAVLISEGDKTVFVNRGDGTIYNDSPIGRESRLEIKNGDEIQFSDFTLSVLNTNFKPKPPLSLPLNGNGNEKKSGKQKEPAAAPALEEDAPEGEFKPTQSFADILSSIRKEEDRFYFQLLSAENEEKIPIEKEEMIFGWDLTGRILSEDPNIVVMPRANIKKDWSGVTVYPQGKDFVWVNGEGLSAPKRLADGDKLTFLSSFSSAPQSDTSLIFCEPAALVEINSILPQELPSVAPDRTDLQDAPEEGEEISQAEAAAQPKNVKAARKNKVWFGFFSFGEIVFMIFGTLVTAVLVYLILEYW